MIPNRRTGTKINKNKRTCDDFKKVSSNKLKAQDTQLFSDEDLAKLR